MKPTPEQLEKLQRIADGINWVVGTGDREALSAVLARLEALEAGQEAAFRAGWNAGCKATSAHAHGGIKLVNGPCAAFNEAWAAYQAKEAPDA